MVKTKQKNVDLVKAKTAKNDEFYTQISDINNELGRYKKYFKDKIIFCNCDDPKESNFWKYFQLNFEFLGLKKLISTHFEIKKPSYKLEIIRTADKPKIIKTPLKQNGDFRSVECVDILKESDIVVTNPPFSLFRPYVAQLMEYNKKFIIIGNQNAITYKETFKLIKDDKMWIGYSLDGRNIWFRIPNTYKKYHKIENGNKYAFVASTIWFTNLDHKKRHDDLILYKKYKDNEKDYPKYDNYNAINVNKTKEIPIDYNGSIGVPITFMHKYNPDQFEIIGLFADKREKSNALIQGVPTYLDEQHKKYVGGIVDGKATYARIIIKKKKKVKKRKEIKIMKKPKGLNREESIN